MKSLTNLFKEENQSVLMFGAIILFLMGIFASIAVEQKLYYIIMQSIGFFGGLILLSYLKKRKNAIQQSEDILLFIAFLLLLFSLLFQDGIKAINLPEWLTDGVRPLFNVGLWSVALVLPYFAKHLSQDKITFMPVAIFTLFDMVLLAIPAYSYFLLFNLVIILGIRFNKLKIPRKFIFIALVLNMIAFTLSVYGNGIHWSFLISDFKNYLIIFDGDYRFGQSLNHFIEHFSFRGRGFLVDTRTLPNALLYDHSLLITNMQFGMVGLTVLISAIWTPLLLLWNNIKCQALQPLTILSGLFILVQLFLGFLQNLDFLPFTIDFSIPFYSYSGLNMLVFFIVLTFMSSEPDVTNNYKESEDTENKKKWLIWEVLGEFFVGIIFTIIILFVLIGMQILYNHNQNPFHPNNIGKSLKNEGICLYEQKKYADTIPVVTNNTIRYHKYTIRYTDSVYAVNANYENDRLEPQIITQRKYYFNQSMITTRFTNLCHYSVNNDLSSLFLFSDGDLGLLVIETNTPGTTGACGGACSVIISIYDYGKNDYPKLVSKISYEDCSDRVYIDDIYMGEYGDLYWQDNKLVLETKDGQVFLFDLTLRIWDER